MWTNYNNFLRAGIAEQCFYRHFDVGASLKRSNDHLSREVWEHGDHLANLSLGWDT